MNIQEALRPYQETVNAQAERIREMGQRIERLSAALEMIYDRWENGDPCFSDLETMSGPLGNAVKLSYEEENEILALIPRIPTKPEVR